MLTPYLIKTDIYKRIRPNRYIILAGAVIMQMCMGATYSWSVYVKPLREFTGLNQGPVQFPFTLFYFAFPATMMLAGTMLLPKLGPKRSAVIGGLVFGSGWLLASLGAVHFLFTVLGIGLAGIGTGLAYIVPITVCIQWFPEHKGLVTGIAVAGFGGGAALISHIGGTLMTKWSATPFQTFAVFGVAFLILVSGAGLFMRYRPDTATGQIPRLPTLKITRRKEFQILYVAMFTGLAAGFAVNANLKELLPYHNPAAGIMAVSLFAVANALGRITWGFIFDRIRPTTAIQANLIFQAGVLTTIFWLPNWPASLAVFAFFTGFNYGGILVIYASSTAQIWSDEHVGQVYGLLFSANIPAAISPIMAGFIFDAFGSFNLAMAILATFMAAAALWVGKNRVVIQGDNPSA